MSNCLCLHTVPVKTFDDLKRRENNLRRQRTLGHALPLAAHSITGTKIKLVRGYGATPVVHLALERGEVEGMTGSLGVIRPCARVDAREDRHHPRAISARATPELADVPAVLSSSTKRTIGSSLDSSSTARRLGAPSWHRRDCRLTASRCCGNAFQAMLKDPEFAAEIDKPSTISGRFPGAGLQAIAERQLSISAPLRERIKALVCSDEKERRSMHRVQPERN